MKSNLSNYKKYPFPTRILVSYIILSVVAMVLLNVIANYVITSNPNKDFFEKILEFPFLIIAYLVEMLISSFILIALCGSKTYRGIGLYYIINSAFIVCPILFVGAIMYLNNANITYTFYNLVTLFLSLTIAPALTCVVKTSVKRCNQCGLINSFKWDSANTESKGLNRRYHNEVKWVGDYGGVNYFADDVVSDGVFEKKVTTTKSVCHACGNLTSESITKEIKVSD